MPQPAKRVIPHMQSVTSAFRPPPIDKVDYPYPMNTLGFHIDIPHKHRGTLEKILWKDAENLLPGLIPSTLLLITLYPG